MFKGSDQSGGIAWLNFHLDGSITCPLSDVLPQPFKLQRECHNSNANTVKYFGLYSEPSDILH